MCHSPGSKACTCVEVLVGGSVDGAERTVDSCGDSRDSVVKCVVGEGAPCGGGVRAWAWNGEFLDEGKMGNCGGRERWSGGCREEPRRKGGITDVGGAGTRNWFRGPAVLEVVLVVTAGNLGDKRPGIFRQRTFRRSERRWGRTIPRLLLFTMLLLVFSGFPTCPVLTTFFGT